MVKRVRPAVVRISSTSGTGTGVIFDTVGDVGYVVTNFHVVEGRRSVSVTVGDSVTHDGRVLGVDTVRDLAVVSLCCGQFTSLAFGDSSDLDPGDEVVSIGYALGIQGSATVTKGIVSAVRYDPAYRAHVIQADAPINPGNSGGPMLSLDGLVLGINTFKHFGADVEGLGFAISADTVLDQIPVLRAGTELPDPEPPVVPLQGDSWGPMSGELRHDPTSTLINVEFADAWVTDMVVEASFVNPYGASDNTWDYGFILRNSLDRPFLQFVVSSDRHWVVLTGQEPPYDQIARGTFSGLNTGARGRNHLMVIAIGERGWFVVNGELMAAAGLESATHSGDVAVMTGAYEGDEVAGASTLYEDFQGYSLERRYGPSDGTIVDDESGNISAQQSGVWTRDVVVEAEFVNPSDGQWDYGFLIRQPEYNRLEVINFANNGWWSHQTRDVRDSEYTEVASGPLANSLATPSRRNHMLLIAIRDAGWLFINDQLVSKLDLAHNQAEGYVSAAANFWLGHRSEVDLHNFTVWKR